MKKIRILFLLGDFEVGGTELHTIQLINNLSVSDFEPYFCCMSKIPETRRHMLNCPTLELGLHSLFTLQIYKKTRKLIEYIRAHEIDIIQSFFGKDTILNAISSYSTGTMSVISKRNITATEFPLHIRFALQIAYRRVRGFLANCEVVKKELSREGIDTNMCHVIYNGVDIERLPPVDTTGRTRAKTRLGLDPSRPVIGIIANPRPVKGIHILLDSMALLKSAITHAPARPMLMVVGTGESIPHLKSQTEELGLQDMVTFVGSTDNVAEYLHAFDIAVLTSLSEGFSNSILEYMAAALPVVATDVGGNRESVADGLTGFIVPAGDKSLLYEKISLLLHNHELRSSMGEEGRKRVENIFSLTTMITNYESYYKKLISSGKTLHQAPKQSEVSL